MAEIQIIGARGSDQRAWLFPRVCASRRSGRPVVLFVPEQYTLQAERDLMTGLDLPGLLNLDVVSPTRLKALVRDTAGSSGRRALDESGRAMAIHQALQACSRDLVFYQHLDSLYGAVPRMDRTLSEFREENLGPEVLEELAGTVRGQARRAKYLDLNRIWRAYDGLLAGRFDDPAAAWSDMCLRLEASGLWRGADLYVYGFDTVRPDLRELILAAVKLCASVSVLLTMAAPSSPSGRTFRVQRDSALSLIASLEQQGDTARLEYVDPPASSSSPISFLEQGLFSDSDRTWPEDPSPTVSLWAAPHPTAEALKAVSVLQSWRREGIPWNRMAVALPPGSPGYGSLLAALKRHHIPFFANRKEELGRHGVSRLLLAALACVSQGYASGPLLEIACSGFGTLSREEGARLAAYVRTWGIDRGRWRKPFTRGEDAAEAEALRGRLIVPLDRLHESLRTASSARESVEAVFAFLQEEGVYRQLQERRDRLTEASRFAEAVVDRQVWNLLLNLLDQLYDLLGDRRASLKEMALLLRGALERSSLSALPEEEEGVHVGRIGHMLPGETDALFLAGMNEGVMAPAAESLLSDSERRALEEKAGRSIGLDQARMGMLVRSDFVRTMSLPEKRLFVSYCLRDENGSALLPGEPVLELRRLFPALKEQGGLLSEKTPLPPDSPSLALEGLSQLLRDLRDGRSGNFSDPWMRSLRRLSLSPETSPEVREMLARLLSPRVPKQIDPGTAVRLFRGSRVSISRLECYAGCPYQFFLRYGLKPCLPDAFEYTSGDAGNFFHLALQQYIDRAVMEPDWPRLDEGRVGTLMDGILSRLTLPWEDGPLREDALGAWQGEEYIRRVRRAASVLTRFASNSDFRVLGTEMEFGGPSGMPPLILDLPDGSRVALQGKIDRLDLYRGPDGEYLRVLDMKSSEHRLDPARMDRGEQLQLMIYLKAALQGLEGALPAGALYFPVQDREVNSPSPEDAEERRLKNAQLKGVVLAEENVIRAMDRDLTPFSLPKVLNRDGSVSGSADWVLPENVLRRLMDAAVRKAGELCSRIRSGSIPVSPSASENFSACSFCDFRSVCPVRKSDERPLPKGLSFGDVGSSGDQ